VTHRTVAAVDLGAESGRVVLGHFDGSRLTLEEVHRFANAPRESDGHLRWNFHAIVEEISTGLDKLAAGEQAIDSVGVDTWGLDYGYLGATGELLDDPIAYRDGRTDGMLAEALRLVGHERLYGATGIQLLEINTVYQLLAESRSTAGRARQQAASTLLFMPDLLHHVLSGAQVAEETAASTSGAYDVVGRRWATELLDQLGVPTNALPEIVPAGTNLGGLRRDVTDAAAFRGTQVVAPGSHDTASAVVGVPFADPRAAYISSGTWSLVGVETPAPVVTDAARRTNLTNEGGVYGTTRLLRNVMGLWLLQECRRQWRRQGAAHTYEQLVALAASAPADGSLVNPDHPDFVQPGDMPERIRAYCRRAGQRPPETVAETARCVLESLAMGYRSTLDDLAAATGRAVPLVHIVGGGSRNDLLNQLTADTAGTPVHAGPVEATALGNILVQLGSLGELHGLGDMREVVRTSDRPHVVTPRPRAELDQRHHQFRAWVHEDLDAAGLTG
jgi:rhamnulokinase